MEATGSEGATKKLSLFVVPEPYDRGRGAAAEPPSLCTKIFGIFAGRCGSVVVRERD